MVFELIPFEMRCPSVITVLLFTIGVPLFWYLHRRITSLEKVVVARCIDIEKLGVIASNLEGMIQSIKDDNRHLGDRIENTIAEMRKEIHRGD